MLRKTPVMPAVKINVISDKLILLYLVISPDLNQDGQDIFQDSQDALECQTESLALRQLILTILYHPDHLDSQTEESCNFRQIF